MRIFKPTLALGAVLALGLPVSTALAQDAAGAPAQTQSGHQPDPQRQAKRMAKTLNLSQDQQSKIEPILADRAQKAEAVRSDSSLAPADRRSKMQGIQQDADSKIEAVLNDQQKQQYEQMKQQHGKGRHAENGGAGAAS